MLVSLGVGCESAGMVGAVGHVGREKLLPPRVLLAWARRRKRRRWCSGRGGCAREAGGQGLGVQLCTRDGGTEFWKIGRKTAQGAFCEMSWRWDLCRGGDEAPVFEKKGEIPGGFQVVPLRGCGMGSWGEFGQ